MAGRRLSVPLAVGLIALSAPAGAAASSAPVWPYVVTSVSGSATWRYSGPSGSGVDTVRFQGRAPRGLRIAGVASVLHGKTSYTDQSSQGCGPITHTKSQSYQGPSFSVQQPFVVVSWNFPVPDQACSGPTANGLLRRLQALMSQKAPLAEFTCERVLLNLSGEAQSGTTGATTGKLTYQAAVILKRI